jgi:hypothetical protein
MGSDASKVSEPFIRAKLESPQRLSRPDGDHTRHIVILDDSTRHPLERCPFPDVLQSMSESGKTDDEPMHDFVVLDCQQLCPARNKHDLVYGRTGAEVLLAGNERVRRQSWPRMLEVERSQSAAFELRRGEQGEGT